MISYTPRTSVPLAGGCPGRSGAVRVWSPSSPSLVPAAGPRCRSGSSAVTDATTRRTRLLLVVNGESDASRFDAMLEAAAPAGFEVVRATTLAEAIAYLQTKTADCVLVDLGPPDAEGVEIIEALARNRVETSLAEAQSIARIGSWELDVATGAVSWSRELYRLFAFPVEEEPSYEAFLERCHPK